MPPKKNWTKKDLEKAVQLSTSRRQVIRRLGLKITGGNHDQVQKYIDLYKIDTTHFKGRTWNKGLSGVGVYRIPLKDILVKNSTYQTYKLKKRLFKEGLREEQCELCGWSKKSKDGRIPVELDHINGISNDHRLENLRILCPNCHSLQSTHRGRNRKDRWH